MADGFVAVYNVVDRILLAAHDPRRITRHDEMSNAHCPLPPILYTSELKGAVEEGFVKWAIESGQCSVWDRERCDVCVLLNYSFPISAYMKG